MLRLRLRLLLRQLPTTTITDEDNSKYKKDNSIIIRADAHSIYPKDYIFECWQAIFDSSGGNAGSIQRAVGTSYFTNVVADVMNSGYAMGGVNYRKIKF